MEKKGLYEQISARTNGDIYIGVVGPVRTGKSTFIKRFMENMVIPRIDNVYKRERAKDELPQSGSGKTIMTAEPKFVPEEAAEIALAPAGSCRVRLVDCVGYLVEGALGSMEEDTPRMVTTPWRDHPIPMAEAAEIGTRKVIEDHSTIGLVITTDGSFSDIPRESYAEVEGRVIEELQAIGKPFLTLVNTVDPEGEEARAVCAHLQQTYGIVAMPVNCLNLDEQRMRSILTAVLYEFPVQQISVVLPRFISILPPEHAVQSSVYDSLRKGGHAVHKMRDFDTMLHILEENEWIESVRIADMDLGVGCARVVVEIPTAVFYQIVTQQTGIQMKDEADLIPVLTRLSDMAKSYERIAGALEQAQRTGYGVVMPELEELSLEPPEIMKQGGRYGVKLCASADSIHLMKAQIKASITPIVGTEKQSEELLDYLMSEFEGAPEKIWQTNIFGKPLSALIGEELSGKLARVPEDARDKFRETLERIINESTGGLICILL
ncbi:MAG: stage IV sporulation protein A [Butyricicoccus pullicaecorum]|nr:stage IV sporulation protein A [Butyricicoccus pullicaecorum]